MFIHTVFSPDSFSILTQLHEDNGKSWARPHPQLEVGPAR